jgi:hypothetical protein
VEPVVQEPRLQLQVRQ